jgi:hypothetical protein
MRRAARVDANQSDIVQALRDLGATVQCLHTLGQGCPDLLVGFRGRNLLLEVKNGNKRVTYDEANWQAVWQGQVAVVHSMDEALSILTEQLRS